MDIMLFIKNNPLELSAIFISLYSVYKSYQQQQRTNKVDDTQNEIKADNLLWKAWGLLGGDLETVTIAKKPSKKRHT